MKYTPIVRGLKRGFYDDKNHKIKLPKQMSIKLVKTNNLEGCRYQIYYKGKPILPVLYSDLELKGNILTVRTLGTSYIDINLKTMEVYPEYINKIGSVALGKNNKPYFVQKDGSFLNLPYSYPYNFQNVKANQSKNGMDNLVVLQNEKGVDALYDAKTLKQIIPFEIKGMINIESALGSGSDGDGDMVYLIKSNKQETAENDDVHLLNKNYTFSFYKENGKKIDEIKNASIMWQKQECEDGLNLTRIAFKTDKDKMVIVEFDNDKSKIIKKMELPFMQKSVGGFNAGIYSSEDVCYLKDGSTIIVTQSKNLKNKKLFGLQKIKPNGEVETLLENTNDSVKINHSNSSVYVDYKSAQSIDSKIGRLSLEGKKHTFNTTVSEFAKLAKKYFPIYENSGFKETKSFGEQNKTVKNRDFASEKTERDESVFNKGA